jgi:hypothetical protein
MPILLELHSVLARSFMLYTAALGLWGMFSYLRSQPLGSSYWGALVIGEIVAVLQAILGISRLLGGNSPGGIVHILYGSLSVITWPAIFGYMRGQRGSRTETLVYGLGSLFLFGIALRAFTTG